MKDGKLNFKKSQLTKRIKDISSLWLFQILSIICAFATQLILARILSVGDFGILSTALTISLIFATISSIGTGPNLLRLFGEKGEIAYKWIRPNIQMLLLSILLFICIYFIAINTYYNSTDTRKLMIVFTILIVSQALHPLAESVFQLEERYVLLSLLRFGVHFSRLIAVLVLLKFNPNVFQLSLAYMYVNVILILVYTGIISRLLKKSLHIPGLDNIVSKNSNEQPSLRNTLQKSLPFALTGIFFLLYTQGNIFLINVMLNKENAGIYSVAFTVMNVIYLFPVTFYQGYLLPKIYKLSNNDKKLFIKLFDFGGKFSFFIGIVIMILLSSMSLLVVPLLFGEEYRSSARALIVLSISIPFRLIANNMGSILITEKNVNKKAFYQFLGVVVNFFTSILFIPLIGLWGAVISVVLTEIIVAWLFVRGVKTNIKELKQHDTKNRWIYITIYLLGSIIILLYLNFVPKFNYLSTLLLILVSIVITFIGKYLYINEKTLDSR